MRSTFPALFTEFLKELPYTLIDRFAGFLRPELLGHRIPSLDVSASEVAFASYGVAGAGSWVHEGKYSEGKPSPLLLNWKVLLGLTAHGRPYLAELIERRHVALAALVWSVSEMALKRYNVCTYEMFARALQAAYADYVDPQRVRADVIAYPLKSEELPVFMYYYGEQCTDSAFIKAVKDTFDCTYALLSDSPGRVARTVGKAVSPEHISMIYMDMIRGPHGELPKAVIHGDYPVPPFGPLRPGKYLYELLYANSFRYRHGGVTVLSGEELPPALVINFNHFIPYREANMTLYDKLRGKKKMSVYDMALAAVEVLRVHYYGVLHDKNIGAYYELLAKADPPVSSDELATTFIIPVQTIKEMSSEACKYGVNYLIGASTMPRDKREPRVRRSRRNVSAKSVLSVVSPDTPYLKSAEFRFLHRYGQMLISPPWPLTMDDVRNYYQEERIIHVAQHLDRVFLPLNILRRIAPAQDHMTPELDNWLRNYDKMSKYVLRAEIKIQNQQGVNKLVRADYGAFHVRFRPEEDDAIIRLYRPRMSDAARTEMMAVCFGRSNHSIAVRAMALRKKLMSEGVYDITKLPHGQRHESILSEIREAKKKEAKDAAESAKAEKDAAKRAAEEAGGRTEVLPV